MPGLRQLQMSTFADVPLPEGLVVPAGPADPFAGAWAGMWSGVIPHVLVAGNGPCVYAVGAVPAWSIGAGWSHRNGVVRNGRLVLSMPGVEVEYWPDGPSLLAGRYQTADGSVTYGRFAKVAANLLRSDTTLPRPVLGLSVRIPSGPGTLAGIWHPARGAPAELAVLSHGSADGVDPKATLTLEGEARWLLDRGYAVLVPMRRGRGASDGVSGETNCCDLRTRVPRDCSAGLLQAVEDLHATIRFGLAQPGVRAGPVLLAGQSRGGFLSIMYAGLHPAAVSGVLSFVGGWTAERCNGAFNIECLAQAGANAWARQIWLHADNDSYYGAGHIRACHAAFEAAGGRAALHVLSGIPGNGHRLVAFPDHWSDMAAAYVRGLG